MSIQKFFDEMDWPALIKQKEWLFDNASDEADGLVNMLDSLMDIAVEDYNIPETTVFPVTTGDKKDE